IIHSIPLLLFICNTHSQKNIVSLPLSISETIQWHLNISLSLGKSVGTYNVPGQPRCPRAHTMSQGTYYVPGKIQCPRAHTTSLGNYNIPGKIQCPRAHT